MPGLFEKPSLCRDHLICTVPKRRVSNVRRVSSVRLTGAARRSRRSAHLVSVRVFATFASDPIRRGRRCAFESSTPMSRHSKKSQRRGRGSGNDQAREAATAAAPGRRFRRVRAASPIGALRLQAWLLLRASWAFGVASLVDIAPLARC